MRTIVVILATFGAFAVAQNISAFVELRGIDGFIANPGILRFSQLNHDAPVVMNIEENLGPGSYALFVHDNGQIVKRSFNDCQFIGRIFTPWDPVRSRSTYTNSVPGYIGFIIVNNDGRKRFSNIIDWISLTPNTINRIVGRSVSLRYAYDYNPKLLNTTGDYRTSLACGVVMSVEVTTGSRDNTIVTPANKIMSPVVTTINPPTTIKNPLTTILINPSSATIRNPPSNNGSSAVRSDASETDTYTNPVLRYFRRLFESLM